MADESNAAQRILKRAYMAERLHYEPATGVLTWRHYEPRGRWWNAVYAGKIAGKTCKDAERRIEMDGCTVSATHVIWLLMTGEWPKAEIDHKNRDHSDNRWGNLREANRTQQAANQRVRKDSKSGVRGVRYSEVCHKWVAYIGVGGKQKYLGLFETIDAAAEARRAAATAAWGEFANG